MRYHRHLNEILAFCSAAFLFAVGLPFDPCQGEPTLVPVVNPGFEEVHGGTVLTDGLPFSNCIPGWTITGANNTECLFDNSGNVGSINPLSLAFSDEAPQGEIVAFSNGAEISQDLAAPIDPNCVYTLLVRVGNRAFITMPAFRIELRAGGVELVAVENDPSPAEGTFGIAALNYVAQPGDSGNLQIRLLHLNPGASDANGPLQVLYDTVQLVKMPKSVAIENTTQATLYASIQAAINDAVNGDVIEVPPGTYHENIDLLGKEITLRSQSPDPNDTILTGLFTDATQVKGSVVLCISGETNNTHIEGFTIRDGNGHFISSVVRRGGGMYCVNSAPRATNCNFTDNTATFGGGQYNHNSDVILSQCRFVDNTVTFRGGGQYNTTGSDTTLTQCDFDNNVADQSGGGIYNDGGTHDLSHCSFSGNKAITIDGGGCYNGVANVILAHCAFSANMAVSGNGGACYNNGSNTTVTGSRFDGNHAGSQGGGVYVFFGTHSFTNCRFTANMATQWGGGLFATNGTYDLINCGFFGNSATTNGGGGGYLASGTSDVVNCLFSGNTSALGGALYIFSISPSIGNCSFANNQAPAGGAIYKNSGGTATIVNSVFWNNLNGEIEIIGGAVRLGHSIIPVGVPGGVGDDGDNLFADPLFVDADGPDDIIGTEDDNLRLQAASPAIDSGNTPAVSDETATDLDGNSRVVDIIDVADSGIPAFGLTVDRGTYEVQACTGLEGDLNCDGMVDLTDLALMAANWLALL
jgi:hypothetical protein